MLVDLDRFQKVNHHLGHRDDPRSR
ncbi:hypothetical protein [Nocardia cyriacigeorgica]